MHANWHQLSPLQIRDWVRVNLPALGIERVASELQKLSDRFAEIGLADQTSSILVTTEVSKAWGLKPPQGWDAAHVEMWKRLPYEVARYITEKRAQDMKAVRKCQNLEAEIRKRLEKENASANAA